MKNPFTKLSGIAVAAMFALFASSGLFVGPTFGADYTIGGISAKSKVGKIVVTGDQITTNNLVDYIQNQDVLRAYAEGMVSNWTHQAWSDGIDWSRLRSVTYTNGHAIDAQDALDEMSKIPLVFGVKISNPWITEYSELRDASSNVLFSGSIGYAGLGGGKDKSFVFWPNVVPLLNNVRSAYVLAFAQDGSTTNYHVDVSNGQMLFPVWVAGARNGILEVGFNDDTYQQFYLSKPATSPVVSKTAGTSSIDGDLSVDDTSTNRLVIRGIVMSKKPIATVILSKKNFVLIDLQGLQYDDVGNLSAERPIGAKAVNEHGQVVPLKLNGNCATSISLLGGRWTLFFVWKTFDVPVDLYVPTTSFGPMAKG